MTEREGFLAAIAADPDDDVSRLVYADWLEERSDALAEFIRLQIELEPLRRPRTDPQAELERVKMLDRIPPGADYSDNETPLARKLLREQELLRSHQADWLGPLAKLRQEDSAHFYPEFRRGFVQSAAIGLSAFLEQGTLLRRSCQALKRLIVIGTLGRCGPLAASPALAGLSELTLAGWLTPTDATTLADSPHLAGLQSLTVWIGAAGDEDVCRALARMPGLRKVVLVQMYGGISTDDPVELDHRADSLAAIMNRDRLLARVERPFARLFPLDGLHIGYGIDAGHLPGGRPVLLVEVNPPVLIYFDADGRMIREEHFDLSEKTPLVKRPANSWEDCDVKELLEVLGREVGFAPKPIFVREFLSEVAGVGITGLPRNYFEELASPNQIDPAEGEETGDFLYWWWSTGQFLLPFGNYFWADGLGRIHSS